MYNGIFLKNFNDFKKNERKTTTTTTTTTTFPLNVTIF